MVMRRQSSGLRRRRSEKKGPQLAGILGGIGAGAIGVTLGAVSYTHLVAQYEEKVLETKHRILRRLARQLGQQIIPYPATGA
ncbi:hypothetical protein DCM80_07785 [Bradyrhizobium sp. WBOS08]|nr:hypothetical protein DCM80_07785 [Bradyrhizobium sp. WBOS08]